MKIIDLSVPIENHTLCDPPSMPTEIEYWDHKRGAEHIKTFFPEATDEDLPDGLGWTIEFVKLTTHSGTHLDAPWHYHPTMNEGEPARTIDEIPLEWCISDGVMLDFSNCPDGYLVTAEDIQNKLDEIGYKLKPLDIVLVQSGAQKFWGTKEYLIKGCGMGKEATLFLLNQGIKVVGTDAWSWDRPLPLVAEEFRETRDSSIIWEGHFAGIEKEYYHLEKLANLDKLPAFGFQVSCLPIKVAKASAGWTRTVAILAE